MTVRGPTKPLPDVNNHCLSPILKAILRETIEWHRWELGDRQLGYKIKK